MIDQLRAHQEEEKRAPEQLQNREAEERQSLIPTAEAVPATEQQPQELHEQQQPQEQEQEQQAPTTKTVEHHQPQASTVAIFFRSDNHNAAADQQKQQLELMLSQFGVTDVGCVDVCSDFELIGVLKEKYGQSVEFPSVFVHGDHLGGAAKLREIGADGLQQQINVPQQQQSGEGEGAPSAEGDESKKEQKDWTGTYVGQGVLDKCLDATEYIASSLNSLLWLPVTILWWPFSGSKPDDTSKKSNEIDFDVVHTNWYWRNLRRRFRLSDKHFSRLHPSYNDVRSVHEYSTIEKMERVSDTQFVIHYNDKSAPDYITAEADKCKAMMEALEERAGKQLVVDVQPTNPQ